MYQSQSSRTTEFITEMTDKNKTPEPERSSGNEVGCNGLLGKDDLKLCPFCGDVPDLATDGSCIDIECCVSMWRQKSDYLTLEQRQTWSVITHRHSEEVESYVLNEVLSEWNTRNLA